MAGTSITTLKLLGLGSLGLLTSSIIYQSIQNIPILINQLNSIYQFNIFKLNNQLTLTKNYIFGSRIVNILLTGLSTFLFSLAFKYSPIDEKHPYLIYSAIGAPLTLLGIYFNSWNYEDKILSKPDLITTTAPKTKSNRSNVTSTTPSSVISEEDAANNQDLNEFDEPEIISKVNTADDLGKSYVHLSDESGISTPTSTQPPSPQIKHQSDEEEDDDEHNVIEEETNEPKEVKHSDEVDLEIQNILIKKEIVQDLENIKFGFKLGSYISSFSLSIALIGLIGDLYFV
ncbi:uncharacterized protein KGF55_004777 [Candida pseudojiufengensis]|uniref:uncharacterized protein n=1 Tax=Candida pseudojiufengensis TaxID=497109 RepID=UPI002225A73F|nr:uncharacterized protein KGF55_004777 [Candida pseudojiufengensis]KAI5960054.1 hypothetical protein KGF55_004777 [Candida pseudojiufengensis]